MKDTGVIPKTEFVSCYLSQYFVTRHFIQYNAGLIWNNALLSICIYNVGFSEKNHWSKRLNWL